MFFIAENKQTPVLSQKPTNNVNLGAADNTAAAINANNLTSNTFTGGFKPPDYIENPAELEEDLKINDDVRNFWELPYTEAGVPPLLTMPGIHTSTDLVFPIIFN